MARSPTTPRKTTTLTQTERTARRLARQQRQIEKELVNQMSGSVPTNGTRMVKFSDLKKLEPLTDTQSDVFESYYDDDATGYLLHGSAGTGKSFLAVYFGLLEILNPESMYKKIVIIRSTVQSRSQGYLPGTMEEKYEPFESPYIDICHDLTGIRDAYQKLKDAHKIEFMSTSFLRGSTIRDAIVIFDEATNCTFSEFSNVICRMSNTTKLFVCGDLKQDDLTTSKYDISGFKDAIQVMNKMSEFRSFRFNTDDIVRSSFVKSWLITCERLGL